MKTKTFIAGNFLFICLAIIFSARTFAHDTGISSLNAEFSGQALTTHADYSMREIEKIAALQDKKQMMALASAVVVLLVDGKEVDPDETNYFLGDGHSITFTQVFKGISGQNIEIKSGLLSKLEPEHRQFFFARRSDGQTASREILSNENKSVTIDFEKLEPNTSFARFLPLGIEHIVFGFDHLLFLLALLLTVKTFGEIAKIVTSFTVAHSITLSLAALNFVQISANLAEPMIAFSIVFVGLENLGKREPKNRWILAYLFGLIHGFGFASALQEAGIGAGAGAIEPLLGFNLGVEIGQIAIVLLVLPILWKLQNLRAFSNRLIPIGSVAVILTGLCWLIERTLF